MSTESTLKIIFGGAAHRRSSGYGWRIHPVKKTKKFHYGVDYACGKVPVYALESGTVYKRGYQAGGAGNYVYVKYPRLGVAVAYFHLTSIAVKQGQSVGRGTRIGVAGTTGGSTGVHLHIGVRNLSTWKWQNPETWLANYTPAGTGSSGGGSAGYRVGSTYTLRANVYVRSGPGTGYAKKLRSALTAGAKAHTVPSRYALLKKGTRVTCKEVKVTGSEVWMKIPSGWVCARKARKVYIM